MFKINKQQVHIVKQREISESWSLKTAFSWIPTHWSWMNWYKHQGRHHNRSFMCNLHARCYVGHSHYHYHRHSNYKIEYQLNSLTPSSKDALSPTSRNLKWLPSGIRKWVNYKSLFLFYFHSISTSLNTWKYPLQPSLNRWLTRSLMNKVEPKKSWT